MPFRYPNKAHLPPIATASDYPMTDTTQVVSPMDAEFSSSAATDSPTESGFSMETTPAPMSSYESGASLDTDRPLLAIESPAFPAPQPGSAPETRSAPTQMNAATMALPRPTLSSRRAGQDGAFGAKLRQMALPLAPLVQLTTGQVHPRFPDTLLNFWLLTDAELESLASFYHQRTPCAWTQHYPCPVAWSSSLPLEEKRRRIGKFMGLRGCETPVKLQSEEELLEEARAARSREEDEVWRRKLSWY